MLENLSPKTKKTGMVVLMLLGVYLAYILSFQKAVSAVALNRQLKDVGTQNGQPVTAISQLDREHGFYLTVLKRYKVQKEDRESRLWQAVSGIAIYNNIAISFSPEEGKPLADTGTVDSAVVYDRFNFSGEYGNLVRLLDTLSKSKGIGRVVSLKIGNNAKLSGEGDKGKLLLSIKMAALPK